MDETRDYFLEGFNEVYAGYKEEPLKFEDLHKLSQADVNRRWDEVQRLLRQGGKK